MLFYLDSTAQTIPRHDAAQCNLDPSSILSIESVVTRSLVDRIFPTCSILCQTILNESLLHPN